MTKVGYYYCRKLLNEYFKEPTNSLLLEKEINSLLVILSIIAGGYWEVVAKGNV